MSTPWLDLLEPLRVAQRGRDRHGNIGSLRWLERVMAERGGRGGTVRNILYKDVGASEEKQRLFEILSELYEQAGLELPTPPQELNAARAKRFLGRDKRPTFNRFVRALSSGERPQLVVVGGPATGKGILLEQLRETLPRCTLVNLARDLAPALYTLAQQLEVVGSYERLIARLSPAQPYALQAALQGEIIALLAQALNRHETPLLLRAEAEATLSTLPLRDKAARTVSLPVWLTPLLEGLAIPYLAAFGEPPERLDYKQLRPPSRDEARRYLRQRVPEATPERIEGLLNHAGRSYGELSRLALLETSRAGDEGEAKLHGDPRLGPLLQALAVLSPEADPEVPSVLLEQALGRPLATLSPAERTLLEPASRAGDELMSVRPAIRSLLPRTTQNLDLHRLALDYYRGRGRLFRELHHARHAAAWEVLLDALEPDPSHLALLPDLWSESRAWPPAHREKLALLVVRYRAVLGDYAHPEAREALELLHASADMQRSGWARVKMAEAHIDVGRFKEAEDLVAELPELSGEAQVEALLVQAALARWRGAYNEAEGLVASATELPAESFLEDRVRLWQGLVAKDAGRFDEALASLVKVGHNPLLVGRARYQEGDLLTRLGNPAEGAKRIRAALESLEGAAPQEELSRVRARLGTPLRHLGWYDEAARELYGALNATADPFTRARITSETSILEAARGRAWEALSLAAEAEAAFRQTRMRPEEAAYRHRRTLFRLAVALWVQDTAQPYRPPFRGTGHAPQAQRLLQDLRTEVAPLAPEADRDASLLVDVVQLLALILPAPDATALLATTAVPVRGYLENQLLLSRAEALLRADDATGAAATLAALRKLPPDPGLRVWKGALEAEMHLLLGRFDIACEVVSELLDLPAPFRQQLGRVWGRALSERGAPELARPWLDDTGLLALPESLALRFEVGDGRTAEAA